VTLHPDDADLLVLLEIYFQAGLMRIPTVAATPAEKIVIDYTQLTNYCSRKMHPAP
jgi:hypothetical protein